MKKIENIFAQVFKISKNEIFSIEKIGGMTNQNYLVKIVKMGGGLDSYCIRLTNEKTNELIYRSYEKFNDCLASEAKFSVESVYFDEKTGIKITKFLDNSQALNHKSINNKNILRQIALQLKELHQSKLEFKNTFNIFDVYKKYFSLLKQKNTFYKYHKKMDLILKAFNTIDLYFQQQNINLCPCHNDLVPENILIKDKVYFIDWEYSGNSDILWELANFMTESRLDNDLKEIFLESYFDRQITEKERQHLKFYTFCCDVLWTLWTALKEESGEFYGNYGFIRINRAYKQLESLKLNE
ncbi:choline kinase family protein [Campylobacter insulaenigrae]|uniref:choline kinase family protein n=2 Tax=Campylobacter insulaenigrae TaxID=260714 RepID=UPI00215264AB|nr:choline kinase family protein [Campylobacter insulaenigrae]MCR6591980.1 choline kinase family protein [Campylobacter insulaenigrae]MCR6593496.1 choline kinase family protein [Campylobacter insulaenigrae]